jgi:hypothetical protein
MHNKFTHESGWHYNEIKLEDKSPGFKILNDNMTGEDVITYKPKDNTFSVPPASRENILAALAAARLAWGQDQPLVVQCHSPEQEKEIREVYSEMVNGDPKLTSTLKIVRNEADFKAALAKPITSKAEDSKGASFSVTPTAKTTTPTIIPTGGLGKK